MPSLAFENAGYSSTNPANNHLCSTGANRVLRHESVQAKKDTVKQKGTQVQGMGSTETVNNSDLEL